MARASSVLAGLFAIGSGIAYLAYWPILRQPDWAITAWNFLIIPTALYLGIRQTPRGPILAAISAGAGVAASLLWATGFRDPALEPWWIGLAAIWWLALGAVLRPEHRLTGLLTLALGVATAIDFVVTLLGVGQPLLALGGLKLPLSTLWSFWIGVVLIRGAGERDRLLVPELASAMALVGGVFWIGGGVGWLLTHGISAANASSARLLELRGTQYTQLLAVAALLWVVALAARRPAPGRPLAATLARASWWVALVGAAMVSAGALFETSIVDPDRDFLHPLVQGGWLLFIGGLLPTMSLGLLGIAAFSRDAPFLRTAYGLAGLLAPLPVVAFLIGDLAARGQPWVAVLGAFHAAPGIGWAIVGLVLGLRLTAVAPLHQPATVA